MPSDDENPFAYQEVKLNFLGSKDYDPSQSWFSVLTIDTVLATLLATYVDNKHIHVSTEELAWQASHQVATRESYLGIQDAAQKRRPPTQHAGTWAGSMIRMNDTEIGMLVSQERWMKTRKIIRKWLD